MTRGDVSICAADMITTVFQNIEGARLSESSRIVGAWRTVVGSIVSRKNGEIVKIGEKLCGHSSVVDVKNGVLLVEADHSGWIQLLHTYQKYIVTGLRRTVPEVKSIPSCSGSGGASAGLGRWTTTRRWPPSGKSARRSSKGRRRFWGGTRRHVRRGARSFPGI